MQVMFFLGLILLVGLSIPIILLAVIIWNFFSDERPTTDSIYIWTEELEESARRLKLRYVSDENVAYIVSIVNELRRDPDVLSGPSIRGGIAIFKCSRALALLEGRDYVIPDDVKELVKPALQHRIKIKVEAEMDGVTSADVLERVVQQVPVPRVEV